jgi:hypothetical protein
MDGGKIELGLLAAYLKTSHITRLPLPKSPKLGQWLVEQFGETSQHRRAVRGGAATESPPGTPKEIVERIKESSKGPAAKTLP